MAFVATLMEGDEPEREIQMFNQRRNYTRYLVAALLIVTFGVLSSNSAQANTLSYSERLAVEREIERVNQEFSFRCVRRAITCTALVAVIGGPMLLIFEDLTEDGQNLAAMSAVAGGLYCMAYEDYCVSMFHELAPLVDRGTRLQNLLN